MILTGFRFDLKLYLQKRSKDMSQPEMISLQHRRVALQKAIYQWSLAQGEYMPHIKWARAHDNFLFAILHGGPPNGSLLYMGTTKRVTSSLSIGVTITAQVPTQSNDPPPKKRPGGSTNNLMDISNAENIKLWLPSNVPFAVRHLVCSERAATTEATLLKTDIHDSLVAVRKYRRAFAVIRSHYLGALSDKTPNQKFTRKKAEIAQVGGRVETNTRHYQDSWERAVLLDPDADHWKTQYRELKKGDVRGPLPGDNTTDLAAVREIRVRDRGVGHQETSWIWLSVKADDECSNQVCRYPPFLRARC
jgi:hypothetical protein